MLLKQNDSLVELVAQHDVTYEEALSKAIDKPDLARRLNKPYQPNT